MESGVEWHNENRGVFMINQYFKQQKNYDDTIKRLGAKLVQLEEKLEIEDFDDLEYHQEQQQEAFNASASLGDLINLDALTTAVSNLTGRQLSFEVDFDIFRNRFWPKVASWTKVAPLVVWTEIYSVIKGGAQIYQYDYCVLPLGVYLSIETRSSKKLDASKFLDVKEKAVIYQIFMHYEKWKQSMGAYDFNDVVNHVIAQLRSGIKPSQAIHFLMVDEVQDLTPNVLFLLTSVTERNVFFCGDTAQTIAKGVGFRFYDMKAVFKNSSLFAAPAVLQLTRNFRSHSRILDLANSVVSLLELLFPKTIDRLRKETSDVDGPKPIFVEPAASED